MILRQYFTLAGVANSVTYEGGLLSTQAERKRLLSVSLSIDEVAANRIQGYHERAKVFDIPDQLIDVETNAGATNLAKPGARINEVEVGLEIPVGETFKMAIQCGATATDVRGCYNYELMGG